MNNHLDRQLDRQLLRLIAERFPAAWDAIIPRFSAVALNPQPLPPRDRQSLNPQPIPPGDEVALNPQPLPPRWYGELIGTEIIRAAWLADLLQIKLKSVAEWDDIPFCGTGPKRPPFPKGPFPKGPTDDPEYLRDYYLGLAGALASVDGRLAESTVIRDGFEIAVGQLV